MFRKTFIVSLTAILTLFMASYSQAATITPNILTDPTVVPVGDPNNCSLRYAIQSINDGVTFFADCANHSTGMLGDNDTIILGPDTYVLTIDGGDNNDNTEGDLDVEVDIVIIGAGSDQTTIDASGFNDKDRVIDFLSVDNATVRGVQMTGGDIFTILSGNGGAIRAVTNSLTLDDVHLFDNQARRGGRSCGHLFANYYQ